MPSQTTLPYTNLCLLAVRERLINSRLYAAHNSIRTKVEWCRDGKAHRLVEKASELAYISITGVISEDDFWMAPDANWRPSAYTPTFDRARLSCTVGRADVDVFAPDHADALRNIEWMQGLVATPGFRMPKGLLQGIHNDTRVKVNMLFLSSGRDAAEHNGNHENGGLDSIFSIEHWPCSTQEARDALPALIETHHVVPVPAYDMHGCLIEPTDYQHCLLGALIEVHFSLTHWAIPGRGEGALGSDVFSADIGKIQVLAPPQPTLVTPRKHRIAAMDPEDSLAPALKRTRM
ncbi:hypothetical protein B0H21DRAFT_709832 [Amylocystis lapponica]|nr:hypothetical protein B0H21DRAFT_709832 [Amylocystis lapponica]